MKYRVLVRKGSNTKATDCIDLYLALRLARWAAFLLDIKILITLPKKSWIKLNNDLCFFQYDITAKKHKEDEFTFVHIESEKLPISLYGKNIKQIEKNIASK